MKNRMFNKLSKRLAAAAIVGLAFAFPVVSMAAQTVKLESTIGVANVTNGESKYKASTNATYDQVVKMEVYYHNTELPDSGKVANDLTVKINIPSGAGKTQTVSSKVSAANANTVNSTANINLANSDAYLQYIPGSAVWKHNTGTNSNVKVVETKISDNVVTSGAGLRLEDEKPCYNFAATVTVLARVRVPGVTVTKQVQKASENNKWTKTNTATPGDTLKYLISYKNSGNSVENQVVLRDNLPEHMTLVPGTTKLATASHPSGVAVQDLVNKGGINAGNFGAGANAFLMFEVKLDDASKFACGSTELKNVGVAHPQGMDEYFDTATTTVTKTCASTPSFVCKDFDVTVDQTNKTVTVSKYETEATNGATFKNVVIDWGDGSDALTTDKAVGQGHAYAEAKDYTITATSHFTVNGKDVTSDGCAKAVSFTTPETPGELPHTGAGQTFALFGAVVVAGTVAHRLFARRRAIRQ